MIELPHFIPFAGPTGMQSVAGEGEHWFEHGDPFANKLSLLMSPSGDDFVATVIYAGVPVLTVQAGSASAYQENGRWNDYHHEFPTYLEKDPQVVQAMFLVMIGEITEEGFEAWRDEEASDEYDFSAGGMSLYAALGEMEGEGHELVAFVGDVAWAMWDDVQKYDAPLPVSPRDLGWVR
jgi:hypothetical protein